MKIDPQRKLNILLVEDDELSGMVTTFYLKRFGHEVDIAKNGYEALNRIMDKKYDLILMDIQMPEMDGMEATRQIIAQRGNQRPLIVAMTANALNSDKEKCLAIGMDLQSVVKASTSDPARIIRHEELGNLSEGSDADIAVLNLRQGKFGLFDYTGYKIEADKKFECEMTIRAGKIVYDLNGIADPVMLPRRSSR